MLGANAEYKNSLALAARDSVKGRCAHLTSEQECDSAKSADEFIPWLKRKLHNQHAIVVLVKASEDNRALLAPLLSAQEYERAQAYLNPNDALLSTVAHGLKRLLLASVLNIAADKLLFGTAAKAKPVCLNTLAPTFNISHSQEWAAIVIAQDLPVGVDIEFPRAMDYASFAESALTPHEYREYKQNENNTRFFLKCWSQKEALSKACGLGLFLDFKTISTNDINPVTINNINYYFYSQEFLKGFISIATTVEQKKMHVILFDTIKHQLLSRPTMPCKL